MSTEARRQLLNLLAKIVGLVFILEFAVMTLVTQLPVSRLVATFVDALALSGVLGGVLGVWVLRPMALRISRANRTLRTFRASVEHDAFILRVAPDGRVLFASRAFGVLLGRESASLIGLGISEGPLRDFAAGFEAYLGSASALPPQLKLAHRLSRPDGPDRYFETTVTRQLAPDGTLEEILLVSIDVTSVHDLFAMARERAQRLSESENDLREAQAVAQIGSWKVDLSDQKIHWSAEMFRIFGLEDRGAGPSLDNVLAQIHPDDVALWNEAVRTCLKTGSLKEVVFRINHPEGLIWAVGRGQALHGPGGRVQRIIGTCQDVSKRFRADRENAMVLNALRLGTWVWDLNNESMTWDDRMYELFELRSVDQPDPARSWLSNQTEESRENIRQALAKAMRDGGDFKTLLELRTRAGGSRFLRLHGTLDLAANGAVRFLHGVCWDQTVETLMERDLARERQRMLQTSKLASLGEMAAGIAHEINNPLAIIDGQISLMARKTNLEEADRKRLESIHKAALRVQKIVGGLRKFARTSNGLTRDRRELGALVEEAHSMANPRALKHGVTVSLEIVPGISVLCDEVEIQQVIINLMNNAIDAVRELPERWVRVEVLKRGDQGLIRVVDSGAGIPEALRDRLFDPFFTTKRANEGTGLGLSICKGIVAQHDGTITLVSESANTCFEVVLPCLESHQAAS